MTGTYFSPGMVVQENKPGLSLISAFLVKCQNTLIRSKGLQGRLVDSGFPVEERLQKIPILNHTGFLCDGAGKSVDTCLAENAK
jgi:hypothetical protein